MLEARTGPSWPSCQERAPHCFLVHIAVARCLEKAHVGEHTAGGAARNMLEHGEVKANVRIYVHDLYHKQRPKPNQLECQTPLSRNTTHTRLIKPNAPARAPASASGSWWTPGPTPTHSWQGSRAPRSGETNNCWHGPRARKNNS